MKYFILVGTFILFLAVPGWVITPAWAAPTDLGISCNQVGIGGYNTFVNAGVGHAVFIFTDQNGVDSSQLLDFNLSTGVGTNVATLIGQLNASYGNTKCWLHPTNRCLYMITDHGRSHKSTLQKYNLNTHVVTTLGTMVRDLHCVYMNPAGTILTIGGTTGHLFTFDIASEVLTDHGEIDPSKPGVPSMVWRIWLYIVQKGDYVYGLMRDAEIGRDYYLVMRISDSTYKSFWKDTGWYSGYLGMGVNGKVYAYGNIAHGVGRTYILNGFADPVVGRFPGLAPDWRSSAKAYTFDYSGVYPTDAGVSTLRYRNPGSRTWKSISINGISTYPTGIDMLAVGNNELIGSNSSYGKLMTLTTKDVWVDHGRTQLGNFYDYLWNPFNQRYYLSGYTAYLAAWNPAVAWNNNPYGMRMTKPGSNPIKLSVPRVPQDDRYYRKMGLGIDRCIYLLGDFAGSTAGGKGFSIHWYNPSHNSTGYYYTKEISQYAPHSFAMLRGDRYLMVSGQIIDSGAEGKLFMFGIKNRAMARVFAPIPGSTTQGTIVELGTMQANGKVTHSKNQMGKMLGLIDGGTGTSTIYLFNTNTEKVEWTTTYKASIGNFTGIGHWWNYNLCMGPDGYAWLMIDKKIVRINPANGAQTVMMASPPATGKLIWFGNYLYIFATSNLHVYKIPKADLGV